MFLTLYTAWNKYTTNVANGLYSGTLPRFLPAFSETLQLFGKVSANRNKILFFSKLLRETPAALARNSKLRTAIPNGLTSLQEGMILLDHQNEHSGHQQS